MKSCCVDRYEITTFLSLLVSFQENEQRRIQEIRAEKRRQAQEEMKKKKGRLMIALRDIFKSALTTHTELDTPIVTRQIIVIQHEKACLF